MSLPRDSKKKFPGTQTDTYSYDHKTMPVDQPPCDRPDQHEFNDNESASQLGTDSYYETARDKWGNEYVPDDREYHREATAGQSSVGNRQFASNSQDLQSTGYGNNMGLNEIPYGTGAGFARADVVTVDVSRADRGRDS